MKNEISTTALTLAATAETEFGRIPDEAAAIPHHRNPYMRRLVRRIAERCRYHHVSPIDGLDAENHLIQSSGLSGARLELACAAVKIWIPSACAAAAHDRTSLRCVLNRSWRSPRRDAHRSPIALPRARASIARPRERRDSARRGLTRAGPSDDDGSESEPPGESLAGRRICGHPQCAVDISARPRQARYCVEHGAQAARRWRVRERNKEAESQRRRVGLRGPVGPRCDACGAYLSRTGKGGALCEPCAFGPEANPYDPPLSVALDGLAASDPLAQTLIACGDWPRSSARARGGVVAHGDQLGIRLSDSQAGRLIERYGSRHACDVLDLLAEGKLRGRHAPGLPTASVDERDAAVLLLPVWHSEVVYDELAAAA